MKPLEKANGRSKLPSVCDLGLYACQLADTLHTLGETMLNDEGLNISLRNDKHEIEELKEIDEIRDSLTYIAETMWLLREDER